jgi:hypothetical protein
MESSVWKTVEENSNSQKKNRKKNIILMNFWLTKVGRKTVLGRMLISKKRKTNCHHDGK